MPFLSPRMVQIGRQAREWQRQFLQAKKIQSSASALAVSGLPSKMISILSGLKRTQAGTIAFAYEFARLALEGKVRRSGCLAIDHAVETAHILYSIGQIRDVELLAAALLHDVIEDGLVKGKDLRCFFSREISDLVLAETKIKAENKEIGDIDYVIQLVKCGRRDPRVYLLKAADALSNMSDQEVFPREKQIEHAREAQVYANFLDALGVWELRVRLEDHVRRVLQPEAYREIVEASAASTLRNQKLLQRFQTLAIERLQSARLGRAKVELWQRYPSEILRRNERDGSNIGQLLEQNPLFFHYFLVETAREEECYLALAALRSPIGPFFPWGSRIDDFLAFPRLNGYRALHLYYNKPFSGQLLLTITYTFQGKSNRLGMIAEGIKRKFSRGWQKCVQPWEGRFFRLIEDGEFMSRQGLQRLISELTTGITVYTDQGESQTLPFGATVLDFARQVHEEVFLMAEGAVVNGRVVPLSYALKEGEMVHVVTGKAVNASLDWLDNVVTAEAQKSLRQWLRNRDREVVLAEGLAALDKYSSRRGLPARVLIKTKLFQTYLRRLGGLHSAEDLIFQIGSGRILAREVDRELKNIFDQEKVELEERFVRLRLRHRDLREKGETEAADRLLVRLLKMETTYWLRVLLPEQINDLDHRPGVFASFVKPLEKLGVSLSESFYYRDQDKTYIVVATKIFRGTSRANLVGQIQRLLLEQVMSQVGRIEEIRDQAEISRALELKKSGLLS